MKRIHIIEDDKDICELLRFHLEKEGFRVAVSMDGPSGQAQLKKSPPDLLVLDLMLPGLSGLEICKQVRRDPALRQMPILIVTARGEESERVVGLELGADDYMVKPFSPRELVARVRALLRRVENFAEADRPVKVGRLFIDTSSYRVTLRGQPVETSMLEFRLLHFLASRPNRAFSRDQLLEAVWGPERYVLPRIVDVYIRHLREKIENRPDDPVYLKTVRGVGYLFDAAGSLKSSAQAGILALLVLAQGLASDLPLF